MGMISSLSATRWFRSSRRPFILHSGGTHIFQYLNGVLFAIFGLFGWLQFIAVENQPVLQVSTKFATQSNASFTKKGVVEVVKNGRFDSSSINKNIIWPSLFALKKAKLTPEVPVYFDQRIPESKADIRLAVSPARWQLEMKRSIVSDNQLQRAMLRVQDYLAIADDMMARRALNDVLLMDPYHVEALDLMIALLQRTGDAESMQHYQARLHQQLPVIDDAWREAWND
ncbi:hypothetical protein [Methylophilus aquaticus]|uniref:Bacterial transcriptional activator domain-containing protein n=1 Tax=Methylophilus aquaticus TaxID=1971610 RepID=A0ABT9JUT8_9PROT|nr:hypothetical protein [Methylophilus aquaticus]MDP8567865.1 hypothetical protein [Methylophilus aquaticus]